MSKIINLILILMLIQLTSGCGYFWRSKPFSEKSNLCNIQLKTFENFTNPYQPGLELRLKKAISDELMNSAYSIVSNSSIPDVTISGRIIEHSQKVLSTSPDQVPTEISLSISILAHFKYKSGREVEYVIKSVPEPYAVVLGEKREDAEKRALSETAMKILHLLSDIEVPLK